MSLKSTPQERRGPPCAEWTSESPPQVTPWQDKTVRLAVQSWRQSIGTWWTTLLSRELSLTKRLSWRGIGLRCWLPGRVFPHGTSLIWRSLQWARSCATAYHSEFLRSSMEYSGSCQSNTPSIVTERRWIMSTRVTFDVALISTGSACSEWSLRSPLEGYFAVILATIAIALLVSGQLVIVQAVLRLLAVVPINYWRYRCSKVKAHRS